MEIKLVLHVGDQNVAGLGEVGVEFDQYRIIVHGDDFQKATGRKSRTIGYVHKKAEVKDPRTGRIYHPPINWLPAANAWPEAVLDRMAVAVQNALATMPGGNQHDKDLVASGQTRPVEMPPPDEPMPAVVAKPDGDSADDENL